MTAYLFRAMLRDRRRVDADSWQEYFQADGLTEADAEQEMCEWIERHRPRVQVVSVELAGDPEGVNVSRTGRA